MDTPFFSLIASAIREDMYIDCYNSFAKTDIPFEMVFVGHKKPKRKMPENFRYIHTRVKPAQCLEIAARNARGKYLIPITESRRDWIMAIREVAKEIKLSWDFLDKK